tara:strand:- start:18 stop:131 length:114 start_codon:yes stop_codon:yes gene_type:complete
MVLSASGETITKHLPEDRFEDTGGLEWETLLDNRSSM